MIQDEQNVIDDVPARLLAAMVRVLSGQPRIAARGELTITAVAAEAQLKRHYLTHRHVDLKELFYELRDYHSNPVREHTSVLEAEVSELKKKLSEAREDVSKWKTTAHTFARAINVLTLENDRLKQQPSNLRQLQKADR